MLSAGCCAIAPEPGQLEAQVSCSGTLATLQQQCIDVLSEYMHPQWKQ